MQVSQSSSNNFMKESKNNLNKLTITFNVNTNESFNNFQKYKPPFEEIYVEEDVANEPHSVDDLAHSDPFEETLIPAESKIGIL